jgi:hypothetical protein
MERNEWELIGMRKFLGFPFCELGKKNIKKKKGIGSFLLLSWLV